MWVIKKQIKSIRQTEVARYVMNGFFATGVHYSVLTINMQVFDMRSAGFANLVAAVFGKTASFIGNRFFVFKNHQNEILNQAFLFLAIYASIACLHGVILYGWTDIYGFDYRVGFIVATILQVALSYLGNKTLVFKS